MDGAVGVGVGVGGHSREREGRWGEEGRRAGSSASVLVRSARSVAVSVARSSAVCTSAAPPLKALCFDDETEGVL